jgi:hypothetical protein
MATKDIGSGSGSGSGMSSDKTDDSSNHLRGDALCSSCTLGKESEWSLVYIHSLIASFFLYILQMFRLRIEQHAESFVTLNDLIALTSMIMTWIWLDRSSVNNMTCSAKNHNNASSLLAFCLLMFLSLLAAIYIPVGTKESLYVRVCMGVFLVGLFFGFFKFIIVSSDYSQRYFLSLMSLVCVCAIIVFCSLSLTSVINVNNNAILQTYLFSLKTNWRNITIFMGLLVATSLILLNESIFSFLKETKVEEAVSETTATARTATSPNEENDESNNKKCMSEDPDNPLCLSARRNQCKFSYCIDEVPVLMTGSGTKHQTESRCISHKMLHNTALKAVANETATVSQKYCVTFHKNDNCDNVCAMYWKNDPVPTTHVTQASMDNMASRLEIIDDTILHVSTEEWLTMQKEKLQESIQ